MGHSTTTAQPAVTVVDISDLTAANAGMAVIEQDGMPLLSTPLRARRVIVRLKSAIVVYHSTNLPVRTRTRVHDGLLAYVTFGPRAAGTVEGIRVRPGMLVVAEPETEAGFVVDPGYESVTCWCRRMTSGNTCRPASAKANFAGRAASKSCAPIRSVPEALFRWGKRLTASASRKPAQFDDGRRERDAAQVELLEALLAAMRSADTLQPVGTERTRQTHNRS